MHQSGSFMLVRADKLDKTPKAFQDYVRNFFVPKNVFGIECFVAIEALSVQIWDGSGRRKQPNGVAPCHSVDVDQYKDGLPEGKTLSEWIREQARKHNILLSFNTSWDDGCCGHPIEVD